MSNLMSTLSHNFGISKRYSMITNNTDDTKNLRLKILIRFLFT